MLPPCPTDLSYQHSVEQHLLFTMYLNISLLWQATNFSILYPCILALRGFKEKHCVPNIVHSHVCSKHCVFSRVFQTLCVLTCVPNIVFSGVFQTLCVLMCVPNTVFSHVFQTLCVPMCVLNMCSHVCSKHCSHMCSKHCVFPCVF